MVSAAAFGWDDCMTCINCIHWSLQKSPLRRAGFAPCKADPDRVLAVSRTFSGLNPCRFGKFDQAAPATVARRMAELQR